MNDDKIDFHREDIGLITSTAVHISNREDLARVPKKKKEEKQRTYRINLFNPLFPDFSRTNQLEKRATLHGDRHAHISAQLHC